MIKQTVLKLRHYGSTRFDPCRFKPIRNVCWNKPDGGFWASPINSPFGWKDYVASNGKQYGVSLSQIFFDFVYEGETLVIDGVKDLKAMKWEKLPFITNRWTPDFELLRANGIDAIYLTVRGHRLTNKSRPFDLFGWDCESVVIFNPDCITQSTNQTMGGICENVPAGSQQQPNKCSGG